MSLSICNKCGGHIPLGADASNQCEICGAGIFCEDFMTKKDKERKELILKIQTILKNGINQNDLEQIVDAYRWLEDLWLTYTPIVSDEMSRFPKFPNALEEKAN